MGLHVLVVDDEPDFAELITHGLEANGFECTRALTGMEALANARRRVPDVVVLDVMLPDLDGFTICEMLRRHPAAAGVPVLLLTCLGGSLSRLNGLASGADDYLTKPFSLSDLTQRLRAVLAHRSQRSAAPV